MTDRLPHTLRSDALDNRERILDAARAVFAADGLDVPMREIARRAGVGPATLYRRFPTKQTLATEAFTEQMHACHAIVQEGLADATSWLLRAAAVALSSLYLLLFVALQLRAFGTFALTETIVFIVLLFVAFVYVWRRGALEWR